MQSEISLLTPSPIHVPHAHLCLIFGVGVGVGVGVAIECVDDDLCFWGDGGDPIGDDARWGPQPSFFFSIGVWGLGLGGGGVGLNHGSQSQVDHRGGGGDRWSPSLHQ